jgi:hypothetical protein
LLIQLFRSLDNIYKKLGPIPLDVLKKITFAASDIAIMDHDSVTNMLLLVGSRWTQLSLR